MNPGSSLPRAHSAVLGLIGVVLTLGLTAVTIAYGTGAYDGGYELTAVFPTSSQGLFTDGATDVKLRGMNVGSVTGIELLVDGSAEITLVIDDGVAIPESATASIEPLSVFGPKFVRIDPGELESSGPWLTDGGEITKTRTGAELTRIIDETADLLARIDPAKVLAVTDAVAAGLSGQGEDLGGTIDDLAVLTGIGARHVDDLSLFLSDLALLAGTVADRTPDALETVARANELLPLVTDHADDIDQLLTATTEISATVSGLLDDHRTDFATTVNAVADLVHGVHQQSGALPDVLDLVATFFGRLSDVIRFDGPAGTGTQLAGLRGFVALDLCLLADICPGAQA